MRRVTFLIDGFNLYHSVRRAQRDLGGATTRWLNIRALCQSYLYLFGSDAQLAEIYYFSALARHLEATKPDVTKRHRDFIKCLKATGISVTLNRFKKKPIWCPNCGQRFNRHEEKETDVAIAAKLFEVFALDTCDLAILVTGDTDLAPAFRTAKMLYPKKQIVFAFPYRRKNKELSALAPGSFTIDKAQYAKHQFANPFILPSGIEIHKPTSW